MNEPLCSCRDPGSPSSGCRRCMAAEIERLRAALEDLLPEVDAAANSEWRLPIDLYSVGQIKRIAVGVAARIREALRPCRFERYHDDASHQFHAGHGCGPATR